MCAGICPTHAIDMKLEDRGIYTPDLISAKCNECSLCVKVCPSVEFEQTLLDSFVFGEEIRRKEDETLLGHHMKCYVGYSLDDNIRWGAASGGLVTTLLILALEEGIIQGALVTRFNAKTLRTEPFIARTKEEIVSAMTSKYAPAPVGAKIKELGKKVKGKIAVVGLPCHIHGIRKAEINNEYLRNIVVLHFGLMCSGVPTMLGTHFLLDVLGMHNKEISEVRYRGEGWPGYFFVKLKNGVQKAVPLSKYSRVIRAFLHLPCLICWDFTNEYSDASFGDAFWIKDERRLGVSVIISRTQIADQLLERAVARGMVKLTEVSPYEVIAAKKGNLDYAKKNLNLKISLLKALGVRSPILKNMGSLSRFKLSSALKLILMFGRYLFLSNQFVMKTIYCPPLLSILRRMLEIDERTNS